MRRGRLLRGSGGHWCALALLCAGLGSAALAQTSPSGPQDTSPPTVQPDVTPKGQVIIQSHGEPPAGPSEPAAGTNSEASGAQAPAPGEDAKADLSDEERSAPLITAYDLDARLTPARSGLTVRAQITVRNDSTAPLKQIALQISSTLHWDSATLLAGAEHIRLPLAQHRLDTDADHTGAETEAILPLPTPLAPGASLPLDLFYSGTVREDGGRLERLGATPAQRHASDWDAISASWTGLRGFGDVLWYPVATPQLFLTEGNALFAAIGRTRLREGNATVRLRLGVEYTGDAPAAAYFCGRRQPLKAAADDPDAPVATATGVATADFAAEPLGFRSPDLFVLQQPEILLPSADGSGSSDAPSAGESSSLQGSQSDTPAADPTKPQTPTDPAPGGAGDAGYLALETTDAGAAEGFAAAAEHVAPLLRQWLGPRPLSALTVLDHEGQPFQDGRLLVAPLSVLQTSPESPAVIESLTHAWVQTGQPWMDEGLAEFFALLWTEREVGREAALARLDELMRPVTLVEPEPGAATSGQPLTAAADELYYRRKAAAVWWMLREQAGDGSLHAALSAWRTQPASQAPPETQAIAFEHLLEHLSGRDLAWLFKDWVLRDPGLPDLTIVDVATAAEPASAGHSNGWLVAVTVRNEGGAVADVPLTIRSGATQKIERIRVPGLSTVTQRVLVEALPTDVVVNDGSVPEVRASTHTRTLNLQTR